jgi:hypothetical protein
MMHAHAASQNRLQLWASPLREVIAFERGEKFRSLTIGEERLAFELLGDGPALGTVEAEQQRRRAARVVITLRDRFQMLAEQRLADPFE